MNLNMKQRNLTEAVLAFIYSLLMLGMLFWIWQSRSLLIMLGCYLIFTVVMIINILRTRKYIDGKNREVLKQIYMDPVTEASNFLKFKLDAEEVLKKNPFGKFAVCYSDIKNFKYINDVYGFETGNKILKRYSDWLSAEHKIAYARINADNFVSLEAYNNADEVAKSCEERIDRACDISGIIEGMTSITIAVGIYCTDGHNDKLAIDGMIDRANIAQKQLKSKKSGGCIIYSEEFRASMLAEQEMENRMRSALSGGEFIVYMQPKFDLKTNQAAAAEALVRWLDPKLGLIPPGQFIPLFERNGFIQELDTYMFEQVCIILRRWIDAGQRVIPISVNVSKLQLNNRTFLSDYIEIKRKYRVPDGLVEIEFTESMLFDNSAKMIEVLEFFKSHGFRSSIDDFGAGYSSLNLLKNLPADILKLDKMFFDKNEYQDREKVIIKNVIAMAKELSMQTVAEGVEEWKQVEFLKAVDCEMVQGFVFDRPLPVAEFEQKYIEADSGGQ